MGRTILSGAASKARADESPRDAPNNQAAGHVEVDMTEKKLAQGGTSHQWDGLDEVGTDLDVGRQARVEQHQQDDHQRAGTNGGHTDHEPSDQPDEQGRQRLQAPGHRVDGDPAPSPKPGAESRLADEAGACNDQGPAEQGLQVGLIGGAVAELIEEPGTGKSCRGASHYQ